MKSTTSIRDMCLSHFRILGIPVAPNDLDSVLERADRESLSHLKFLDLLLGGQAAARRDPAIEWRIRQARFAERQALETFDWKSNPQHGGLQMHELASGHFIAGQSHRILD